MRTIETQTLDLSQHIARYPTAAALCRCSAGVLLECSLQAAFHSAVKKVLEIKVGQHLAGPHVSCNCLCSTMPLIDYSS